MNEIRIILDTETRKRLQIKRQVTRFMDFQIAKDLKYKLFSNYKIRGKRIVIICILDAKAYFKIFCPYFAPKLSSWQFI
jgi:uncharacterized sporulation protein YeaH/YhbH (DUF444 family)